MPQISVVIPAYNAEGTIERAVRSMLDQTLADIEVIIVDDGSTDQTAAAAEAINDPRLRVIRQQHQGVAAAANTALAAAATPLIARMDADDYSHPTRLAEQLALLEREQLNVVGCQVNIVDASGTPVENLRRYEHWLNDETLTPDQILALRFVEYPLANPTLLGRRAFFELGYRAAPSPAEAFPEDYDLMLRGAAAGLRFGKVARPLLDWIDHDRRLTRSHAAYTPAAFDRCRRTHLLAGPLANRLEVDLAGVGQTGKPWLRWLQSEGLAVRRAYDINPRKHGVVIHGVRVDDPQQMPPADGTPLVIAVGSEGARGVISPDLLDRGYVLGRDAWFVA
ncbi:putative glycosyltransferase EpsJ [Posidoniimonas polymericola]|uniref:Putative glycosyltransferase EpsJ n=1 Tax=Posidoniimonas polymericola TaxID=2528002 RepID=A0A5C5YT32_9BACT|nr:glycosyltransferase [Posidoniimonas polymericola]TWT77961.1 putative glycosyltransferase EpsJ [Posidoniimonas polymericola]